jgi:hypothetical protein
MLEGRSTDDLRAIAMAGGGLEINGVSTRRMMKATAMALTENAHLIIHNSKTKSTDDLRAIAMGGRGKVIFA